MVRLSVLDPSTIPALSNSLPPLRIERMSLLKSPAFEDFNEVALGVFIKKAFALKASDRLMPMRRLALQFSTNGSEEKVIVEIMKDNAVTVMNT